MNGSGLAVDGGAFGEGPGGAEGVGPGGAGLGGAVGRGAARGCLQRGHRIGHGSNGVAAGRPAPGGTAHLVPVARREAGEGGVGAWRAREIIQGVLPVPRPRQFSERKVALADADGARVVGEADLLFHHARHLALLVGLHAQLAPDKVPPIGEVKHGNAVAHRHAVEVAMVEQAVEMLEAEPLRPGAVVGSSRVSRIPASMSMTPLLKMVSTPGHVPAA